MLELFFIARELVHCLLEKVTQAAIFFKITEVKDHSNDGNKDYNDDTIYKK